MSYMTSEEERTYSQTETEAVFCLGILAGAIAGSLAAVIAIVLLQAIR